MADALTEKTRAGGPFGTGNAYLEDTAVPLDQLVMAPMGVRQLPIKSELVQALQAQTTLVYGPGYTVIVRSAAQPEGPKGTPGTTGTRRHGTGVAADIVVKDSSGKALTPNQLVPLAQQWLASKTGSVGFPANGTSWLHLDLIGGKGPGAVPLQRGEGPLWYYGNPSMPQSSALTAAAEGRTKAIPAPPGFGAAPAPHPNVPQTLGPAGGPPTGPYAPPRAATAGPAGTTSRLGAGLPQAQAPTATLRTPAQVSGFYSGFGLQDPSAGNTASWNSLTTPPMIKTAGDASGFYSGFSLPPAAPAVADRADQIRAALDAMPDPNAVVGDRADQLRAALDAMPPAPTEVASLEPPLRTIFPQPATGVTTPSTPLPVPATGLTIPTAPPRIAATGNTVASLPPDIAATGLMQPSPVSSGFGDRPTVVAPNSPGRPVPPELRTALANLPNTDPAAAADAFYRQFDLAGRPDHPAPNTFNAPPVSAGFNSAVPPWSAPAPTLPARSFGGNSAVPAWQAPTPTLPYSPANAGDSLAFAPPAGAPNLSADYPSPFDGRSNYARFGFSTPDEAASPPEYGPAFQVDMAGSDWSNQYGLRPQDYSQPPASPPLPASGNSLASAPDESPFQDVTPEQARFLFPGSFDWASGAGASLNTPPSLPPPLAATGVTVPSPPRVDAPQFAGPAGGAYSPPLTTIFKSAQVPQTPGPAGGYYSPPSDLPFQRQAAPVAMSNVPTRPGPAGGDYSPPASSSQFTAEQQQAIDDTNPPLQTIFRQPAPVPMDRYHLTPSEMVQVVSQMLPGIKLDPTAASPQELQRLIDAMPALEGVPPQQAINAMQRTGLMDIINKMVPSHPTNFGDRMLGNLGGIGNLPPVVPADMLGLKTALTSPQGQYALNSVNTLPRREVSDSDGSQPGSIGSWAAPYVSTKIPALSLNVSPPSSGSSSGASAWATPYVAANPPPLQTIFKSAVNVPQTAGPAGGAYSPPSTPASNFGDTWYNNKANTDSWMGLAPAAPKNVSGSPDDRNTGSSSVALNDRQYKTVTKTIAASGGPEYLPSVTGRMVPAPVVTKNFSGSPDDRDSPTGMARAVPGLTSPVFAKPPAPVRNPNYVPAHTVQVRVAVPQTYGPVGQPAPVLHPAIVQALTKVQQLQAQGLSPAAAYNKAGADAIAQAANPGLGTAYGNITGNSGFANQSQYGASQVRFG